MFENHSNFISLIIGTLPLTDILGVSELKKLYEQLYSNVICMLNSEIFPIRIQTK